MALRFVVLAAAFSGLSMCATTPAPEPAAQEDPSAQVGPDGLVLHTAPTDAIDSGALPEPVANDDGDG